MSVTNTVRRKTDSYLNGDRVNLAQSNINYKYSRQVTIKAIKTYIFAREGLHPRKFCRRWFGLEDVDKYGKRRYTEECILAMESEHGYREKCINLIARILKIKPNTIHRWGKGVEFDKIPADKRLQYEVYLGYVDTVRVFTVSLAELDDNSALKFLSELEKEFEIKCL